MSFSRLNKKEDKTRRYANLISSKCWITFAESTYGLIFHLTNVVMSNVSEINRWNDNLGQDMYFRSFHLKYRLKDSKFQIMRNGHSNNIVEHNQQHSLFIKFLDHKKDYKRIYNRDIRYWNYWPLILFRLLSSLYFQGSKYLKICFPIKCLVLVHAMTI